jgi:hypothetical protein
MSRRGRGGRGRNHQNRQGGHNGGPQHGQGQRSEQRQPQQHAGQSHQTQQQHQHQQPHRPSQTHRSGEDHGAQQTSQAGQPGKLSFASALQPRRSIHRPAKEMMVAPMNPSKIYKAVFYDTLNQAKADLEALRNLALSCDQINIIVRAEASMDDAELNAVGKLFCGAAWALIHERRKQDGWYEGPHE